MIKLLYTSWDDRLQKLTFSNEREIIFDDSYFIDGFSNFNNFLNTDVVFLDKIPDTKYIIIINHNNDSETIQFLSDNNQIIRDLQNHKCKLIITKVEGDVNDSGFTNINMGPWPDFLESNKIAVSNFILMTPELFLDNYEKSLPINFVFYNRWAVQMSTYKPNFPLDSFIHSKNFYRQKYFYTVARTPRPHRVDLIRFLNKNNFLDKGNITLFENEHPAHSQIFDKSFENMNAIGADLRLKGLTISPSFLINFNRILDSYFQIVTTSIWKQDVESEVNHIFFNEKIWKSFISLSPFILIGEYRTLEALRGMGFNTFEPFIDESYDTIKDYELKRDKIFGEIKRLCSMSIDELDDLFWDLEDRLLYNFSRLTEYAIEETDRFSKLLKDEWYTLDRDKWGISD